MPYIYSTLSNDNTYCHYEPLPDGQTQPQGIRNIAWSFTVNGKANVMNKRTMVTPLGAVTSISSEDLDVLKRCSGFQRQVKAGFIRFDQKKEDPDKVAKRDMTARDNSSQLVDSDFAKDKKPIVNTSKAV